jgi:hypothetical protein
VLLDPRQVDVEAALELLGGRQRRVGRGGGGELLGGRLQRGGEVGLLGREVVVQQGLGDAGLAGDARHRQLAVGVLGEQPLAQLDELGAPGVDVEASVRGAGGVGHRGQPSAVLTRGRQRRGP